MTDMVKDFNDAEQLVNARAAAAQDARVPMNLAAIFGSLGINVRNRNTKNDNGL